MKHDRLVSCHASGGYNMLLWLCLAPLLSPTLPGGAAIMLTDISYGDECSLVHCPELTACPDDSQWENDADDVIDFESDDDDIDAAEVAEVDAATGNPFDDVDIEALGPIQYVGVRPETSIAATPTTTATATTTKTIATHMRAAPNNAPNAKNSTTQRILETLQRSRRQISAMEAAQQRCCGSTEKCICRQCAHMPKCPVGEVALELSVGTGQPGSCCTAYVCAAEPNCNSGSSVLVNFWRGSCNKCKCVLGYPICHEQCQQNDAAADDSLYQNVNRPTPNRDCFSMYWQESKLHGETWLEDNDCSNCRCVNGENDCITSFCTQPECEDPVKIAGRCCPVCLSKYRSAKDDSTVRHNSTANSDQDVAVTEASNNRTTARTTVAATSSSGRPDTKTTAFAPTTEPLVSSSSSSFSISVDGIVIEPATSAPAIDVDLSSVSSTTDTATGEPETTTGNADVDDNEEATTTGLASKASLDEHTNTEPSTGESTSSATAFETVMASTTDKTARNATEDTFTSTTTTTTLPTTTPESNANQPMITSSSSSGESSSKRTTTTNPESSTELPLVDDDSTVSTTTATAAPALSSTTTSGSSSISPVTHSLPTTTTTKAVTSTSAKPGTTTDAPSFSSSTNNNEDPTTATAATLATHATSAPVLSAPESNSYRQSEPVSEQDYRFATTSDQPKSNNSSPDGVLLCIMWMILGCGLLASVACAGYCGLRKCQEKKQHKTLYSAVPNSETNLSATTMNVSIA